MKHRKLRRKQRRGGRQHNLSPSSLPERCQFARNNALHVGSAMRRDPTLSLTRVAKLQGIKPATVKKYLPSALKVSNGRFRATKRDRYSATLYIPDSQGNSVPVKTRSSKEREELSNYLRDLGRYLRGDRNALARWHGKKIAGMELVTDGRTIKLLNRRFPIFLYIAHSTVVPVRASKLAEVLRVLQQWESEQAAREFSR